MCVCKSAYKSEVTWCMYMHTESRYLCLVCMCIACMHVCVPICGDTDVYKVHMHAYTHTRIHTNKYLFCMYMLWQLFPHRSTRTRNTSGHMHTYIHTYMHNYLFFWMYMLWQLSLTGAQGQGTLLDIWHTHIHSCMHELSFFLDVHALTTLFSQEHKDKEHFWTSGINIAP